MGCGSNNAIKDSCEDKEAIDSFKKLENTMKYYKEAIDEYKNYLNEYLDLLEQKLLCEKEIENYFNLQKRINFQNEPEEIRNYRKSFNRVNRLEERLNIGPGIIAQIKTRKIKKEENRKNKGKEVIKEENKKTENKEN